MSELQNSLARTGPPIVTKAPPIVTAFCTKSAETLIVMACCRSAANRLQTTQTDQCSECMPKSIVTTQLPYRNDSVLRHMQRTATTRMRDANKHANKSAARTKAQCCRGCKRTRFPIHSNVESLSILILLVTSKPCTDGPRLQPILGSKPRGIVTGDRFESPPYRYRFLCASCHTPTCPPIPRFRGSLICSLNL